MRQRETLAKLDGIVALRRLQLRGAQAQAARAAADSAEQRARALSVDEMQDALRLGWETSTSGGRYDPEVALRWSLACLAGELRQTRETEAARDAEARERALREAWRSASTRHDQSETSVTDARRALRRAQDEAADHAASDRHGHRTRMTR